MRNKFFVLVLAALFAMPCVLRAEEQVIQLFEVVEAGTLPGDEPLDGNDHMPDTPPRPTDFRATINGNALSINKLESTIPSAQATVVNASTGSIVLNQQFTTSLSEQIATQGIYILHIQTDGGALVGQFIVQ